MGVKVAVIGGGSTYTPELTMGFLERSAFLPIDTLWLMDIDQNRLDIVGGFVRRMVEARNAPFTVKLTTNRSEAIEGADYVITQLRVGQMQARREDEYLAWRHGLIGQETTGVGGMAKALRTIPVILDIAQEIRALAPRALLVNFTNPAGLITQALSQYAPDVQAVGLCNTPITAKMMLLHLLSEALHRPLAAENTFLDTLGLNHLTWHRGLVVDGEEMWPKVLEVYQERLRTQANPEWDIELIQALGMIPSYYLTYYYYPERALAAQAQWPPSRAERVIEIEQRLLAEYADPQRSDPPPGLMERGGAYYSTVATQLIAAHYNNLGEIHVVNTLNRGAVAEWPDDWVLELPARVDREGIHPLQTKALPPVCCGLLAQVKCYELLTVEAAVHGDRRAAYQALLVHPLGPKAAKAQAVLEDILATHRVYLPQFWR